MYKGNYITFYYIILDMNMVNTMFERYSINKSINF